LSEYRFETTDTTRHEISIKDYQEDYKKADQTETRLRNDSFFNSSHFNYNIIRS